MANNLKDHLKEVADAIRAKKGTSELINPQDFATEIEGISGGGSGGGEGESPMIICITKEALFKVLTGDVPDDIPQEEFAGAMTSVQSELPVIGYRRSSYTNPDGGTTGLHAIQEMYNELQENWLTYQTLKSLAINYSQLTIDKSDRKIKEIWRELATTREEAITYLNQLFPEQITLEEFLA